MGLGSSRLGSSEAPHPHPHPGRGRGRGIPKVNRTKQRLASLICGASASSTSREDCAVESLVNSTDYSQQVVDKLPSLSNEPILTSSGGTEFTSWSSPGSGPRASSESSPTSSKHAFADDDSHIESSGKRKCLSEIDEVGSPQRISPENKCCQQKQGDSVTSSSTGHIATASVYPNVPVISNCDALVSTDMPHTTADVMYPSSVQPEEPERLPSFLEEINGIVGNNNSDSGPIPIVSDPGIGSQSRGDDTIQEVIPSGLELPMLDRVQAPPEGSVLHVDLVSISSDVLPNINNEITTRETRRNNRRTFLDAFSSRSSRRHADFPAILFTTEDADLMGSRRRWLLDIGDDFFDDGIAVDSWHLSRRSREHRRNSRSEFWDRLRGVTSDSSRHTSCPFDLHTDGSCSCELDEEGSALSSISRIVLLAEALFEVLDEIHRQPESFSLSMLSVPAPESVVDSLPLRAYEKSNTFECGDEVDQCHICLVEYEEGDKIRVLPCQHEYHMSCVDKWLKEVHGVCPLCRGDVRGEGVREGAAPSTSGAGLT